MSARERHAGSRTAREMEGERASFEGVGPMVGPWPRVVQSRAEREDKKTRQQKISENTVCRLRARTCCAVVLALPGKVEWCEVGRRTRKLLAHRAGSFLDEAFKFY